MTDSPILPGAHAWRDAQGRPLPVEFFKFLRDLQSYIQQTTGNAESLDAITARILALETAPPASIRGIGSIEIKSGTAQLIGDTDNPSGYQFYGSGFDGERGWYNVADAIEPGTGLTLQVSDNGYTVLGELDNYGQLPSSAAPLSAYIIEGDYWAWNGTEWTNVGPPSNKAVLGVIAGTYKDDGLLWNPGSIPPNYEVGPVVRNPMTTTGDLIYADPSTSPARLGIGSTGQVLTVVSGKPAWAPNLGGVLNLDGGRADSVYGGTTAIDGGGA